MTESFTDFYRETNRPDLLPLPPLLLIDQRGDAAQAVSGSQTPTPNVATCPLIRIDGEWSAPEDPPFEAVTLIGQVFDPRITKVVIDEVDGLRVEAALKDGTYHFWGLSPESFPGGTQLFLDAAGEVLFEREVPMSLPD